MTKIDACLSLSHAFTRRNGRLPKGMRERFIARAIKEGVPLNPPSTAGLGNLGLASALFIVLLITAAAIRTGPFSRPVCGCRSFRRCATGKSCSRGKPHTAGFDDDSSSERRDRSRVARSRSVLVQWRRDPSLDFQTMKDGGVPHHLQSFQNRYFPAVILFAALYAGDHAVGFRPLSSWPDTPSRFRLAVPQPLIREGALRLLAESEQGAAKPMIIPSQLTFANPGEVSSCSRHGSLQNSSDL